MKNGLALFDLLDACAAQISTTECLSSMIVLTENKGDLVSEIKGTVAKLGLCITLSGVYALNKRSNASKPLWFPINFSAVVTEQVLINRSDKGTGKPAQMIASQVADALHHYKSDWGTVVALSIRPLKSKGYNEYEVEFQIGE